MQTLDQTTAAMIALAEAGIPADVQELLVRGDPDRGIAPGAIAKALNTRPTAPVEGLDTVEYQVYDAYGRWQSVRKFVFDLKVNADHRELVTRSQAEAIIAAKDEAVKDAKQSRDDWKKLAKDLQADNAELTARVKELEHSELVKGVNTQYANALAYLEMTENDDPEEFAKRIWDEREALETQLAAANKRADELEAAWLKAEALLSEAKP